MKKLLTVLIFLATFAPQLMAQGDSHKPAENSWIEQFQWRSIGPATMGGRITAISVYEKDPSIFYVATASGGLLKTINNGITFQHQFDHETTVSIGDVCVSATDPNIVWIGTGEENPRNSVSYGDGVYKSVDGGKTWKNMGLKETFQIGSVVIHPTDPNIVYVGALGRLYGPNEERGLYKTIDGGENWQRVFAIDNMTGVIEVTMHPTDPETLLVATYERQRDGFDIDPPLKKIAPGSGLYRTVDGGKTFLQLIEGLPTVMKGRIGTAYYRKDPNIVFACIETELIGKRGAKVGWAGIEGSDAETGAKIEWVHKEGPAAKAGVETEDIVISIGDKTVLNSAQMLEQINLHEVGTVVAFEVVRNGEAQVLKVTLTARPEQGATRPRGGRSRSDGTPYGRSLGGQQANVTNQQGVNGFEHGGIYRSADGGTNWERVNSLLDRPMYYSQIRVDPNDADTVYLVGDSLNRSTDGGKTFNSDASRGVHSDLHALWIDPSDSRHMLLGSDGGAYVTYDRCANWDHFNQMALAQFYHVAVGPRRDYWVYGGLQDNGTWGAPHRSARDSGIVSEDWLQLGGSDGFQVRVDENDPDQIYTSSYLGDIQRTNLRTQERASLQPSAPKGTEYRFNWETPFLLSHYNSRIYYSAGNYVFRSLDRGNGLKVISPEITRTDQGSATALTESPRDSDVLYVGTDDGAVWGTKDGGKGWTNLWEIPDGGSEEETARMSIVEASLRHGQKVDTAETDTSDTDATETDATETDTPDTDTAETDTAADSVATPPDADESESTKEKKPDEGDPLHALVPGPRCVSSLEASRFVAGRCYMTLDGHRSDDDSPYVLVTENYGQTWRLLSNDLPRGSTRAIREDRENPDVLYVGTEFSAWVTIDRGEHWTRLNNNLPTVAVHDFAQHRSSGEIVAATHGRSLWVLDVTALRQLSDKELAADVHLFKPNSVVVWRRKHRRGGSSVRRFQGANPTNSAEIFYSLGKKANSVDLKILNLEGTVIATLGTSPDKGLHKVAWDLRSQQNANSGNQDPRPRRRRRFRGGRTVATGIYKAVLTVDGKVFTQKFTLEQDPNFPAAAPRQ